MMAGGVPPTSGDYRKYDKLLRELEDDSVDTDLLEDELRSLQATEPTTCRGRTVRWLGSGPVHLVVCVLIMVDAAIVIAEILLDLHAMRSKYTEVSTDVSQLIDFLREHHGTDVIGHGYDDVTRLIDQLKASRSSSANGSHLSHATKHQYLVSNLSLLHSLAVAVSSDLTALVSLTNSTAAEKYISDDCRRFISGDSVFAGLRAAVLPVDYFFWHNNTNCTRDDPAVMRHAGNSSGNVYSAASCVYSNQTWLELLDESFSNLLRERFPTDFLSSLSRLKLFEGGHEIENGTRELGGHWNVSALGGGSEFGDGGIHDGGDRNSYAMMLQCAAHALHYISIFILGLFVLQVFVKLYAMGADFFRSRMEIFDGVITLTSFSLDLAFLEGVSVVQGEEAIALLVVFLLWRILRLVNGLLVAAKQRQEFRIKLQKRGRLRSEKRVSILELEVNRREREIENLIRLCAEKGCASREEIAACRPKHAPRQLNASTGLSSVASFSLGLSMSMRGPTDDPPLPAPPPATPHPFYAAPSPAGLQHHHARLHSSPAFLPRLNGGGHRMAARKQSFQELFPVHPVVGAASPGVGGHRRYSGMPLGGSGGQRCAAGRLGEEQGRVRTSSLSVVGCFLRRGSDAVRERSVSNPGSAIAAENNDDVITFSAPPMTSPSNDDVTGLAMIEESPTEEPVSVATQACSSTEKLLALRGAKKPMTSSSCTKVMASSSCAKPTTAQSYAKAMTSPNCTTVAVMSAGGVGSVAAAAAASVAAAAGVASVAAASAANTTAANTTAPNTTRQRGNGMAAEKRQFLSGFDNFLVQISPDGQKDGTIVGLNERDILKSDAADVERENLKACTVELSVPQPKSCAIPNSESKTNPSLDKTLVTDSKCDAEKPGVSLRKTLRLESLNVLWKKSDFKAGRVSLNNCLSWDEMAKEHLTGTADEKISPEPEMRQKKNSGSDRSKKADADALNNSDIQNSSTCNNSDACNSDVRPSEICNSDSLALCSDNLNFALPKREFLSKNRAESSSSETQKDASVKGDKSRSLAACPCDVSAQLLQCDVIDGSCDKTTELNKCKGAELSLAESNIQKASDILNPSRKDSKSSAG